MFTSEEDYVSLETAKMLKEKGYDTPCNASILKDGTLRLHDREQSWDEMIRTKSECLEFLCPTLYEAQKWIWEKHKMFVSAAPNPPFTVPLEFFFWIDFPTETIDNFGSLVIVEHFSSFQQALDAGIRKVLELIKED